MFHVCCCANTSNKNSLRKWFVIWKQKPTCPYILICSLAIACSTFPYSLHCKHVHTGSQLGLWRPQRIRHGGLVSTRTYSGLIRVMNVKPTGWISATARPSLLQSWFYRHPMVWSGLWASWMSSLCRKEQPSPYILPGEREWERDREGWVQTFWVKDTGMGMLLLWLSGH